MAIEAKQNVDIAKEVQRAETLSFLHFPAIFNSPFGGTTMSDITTAMRGALEEIGLAEGIQLRHLSEEVQAMLGGGGTGPIQLVTYDYALSAGSPLGKSDTVTGSGNAIVFDISSVKSDSGWVQIGVLLTHTGGPSEVGITFWDDPDQAIPSVANARITAQMSLAVGAKIHHTIRVLAKDGKVSFTIAGSPLNTVDYTVSLFAI